MYAGELSIAAVICAAGSSSRMGGVKKEYRFLNTSGEKPLTVLGAAVSAFASIPLIKHIVITLPPHQAKTDSDALSGIVEELRLIDPHCEYPSSGGAQSRVLFVTGGTTRRASVHNALTRLEEYNPSYVLIHDGARPWIKRELIEKIIKAVTRYNAVIPALPLIETPKELSGAMETNAPEAEPAFIKRHLRRAELCTAQTPQAFKFPEILKAHEQAAEREKREPATEARGAASQKRGSPLVLFEYTDDAEVWGEFMGQVAVIPGEIENRKITYPEDLK